MPASDGGSTEKLIGNLTLICCLGVRIACIGRKGPHRNHSNASDQFSLPARKYQPDRARLSYFITRWNREFGSISVAIRFHQAEKLLVILRTIEGTTGSRRQAIRDRRLTPKSACWSPWQTQIIFRSSSRFRDLLRGRPHRLAKDRSLRAKRLHQANTVQSCRHWTCGIPDSKTIPKVLGMITAACHAVVWPNCVRATEPQFL
jgi:hypothetical protein